MKKRDLALATSIAHSSIKDLLDTAAKVSTDSDKEKRLARCYCKACFYRRRIGGAAMTPRNCECCGSEELYSSTITDSLCLDCAKKHSLCKRCSGDMDLNLKRKTWPEGAL